MYITRSELNSIVRTLDKNNMLQQEKPFAEARSEKFSLIDVAKRIAEVGKNLLEQSEQNFLKQAEEYGYPSFRASVIETGIKNTHIYKAME